MTYQRFRAFVSLWFLLFSLPVHAAQVCLSYGDPTDWVFTTVPNTAITVPSQFGGVNSTPANLSANSSGITSWWYYHDQFGWYPQWQAVTYATLANPQMLIDLTAVRLAANPVTAAQDFENKYATVPIDDPLLLPIWCPVWAQIRAGIQPPYPYKVTPLAGYQYRATYTTTAAFNGTRVTPAVGKVIMVDPATGPTPCNCMAGRVVETSSATPPVTTTYCSVLNNSQLVANCVPK